MRMCTIVVVMSLDFRRSLESGVILVPRASVSFGHVVGVNDILRRVALGTRMVRSMFLHAFGVVESRAPFPKSGC